MASKKASAKVSKKASKKVSKKASVKVSKKVTKKVLGAKGPSTEDREQLLAFRKDIGKLAVAHGLAATAASVNCRWEPRLRNGKIVFVWVCG